MSKLREKVDYSFQNAIVNIISTVKSSNLPKSIKKLKIHLPTSGTWEKFATGPTTPKPGPTFPKQVATEPNAESKSRPNKAITMEPKMKIMM